MSKKENASNNCLVLDGKKLYWYIKYTSFFHFEADMNKELLHTKLVRELIALISSGTYGDGARLPAERKLCEQFNVSRGTVRLALYDLEKLGILKIKAGSGAYVQKISQRKLPTYFLPPDFVNVSIADIICARKAIETAAITLACEKISARQIEELEQLIEKMEQSRDNLLEFLKLDMEFHQSIIHASGNMPLVTAFESIADYLKYSQVFSSLYESEVQTAIDFHKKMLWALKTRSSKNGAKAILKHLEHTQQITSSIKRNKNISA
ncbi:MAG: FadR/GntR family transcriptional regulator [Sedimentisphaerales bacterium]|jgi:GntR family transcriptional repressor for pyruvate dehydrogenase complex